MCQVPIRLILQSLHTKIKMKVFLPLQQKLDILHEAYHAPGVIKSTAHKYNVDPVQIQQWKKNLAGMDGDVDSSEVLYISSKGWAKKTIHNVKSHVDAKHYGAICLMFDTLSTRTHGFCDDANSGIKKDNRESCVIAYFE